MQPSVGILSVGAYLPATVRGNDWWPPKVVAAWREKLTRRVERISDQRVNASPGAKLAMAEMMKLAHDPFQGGIERRVIAEGMPATDMETAAAEQAIERAGIDRNEIGLVLSYTMIPDFINVPSACVVHANLRLPERCVTLAVDAVCNSFLMQLTLAREFIASGRVRYALLTQSSALTRLPPSGELHDAWMGDAGTSVVLGRVSDGKGILGYKHFTDGTLHGALVCGVPGRRWFDDGQVIAYSEDHAANFDMFTRIVDRAKQAIEESLAEAGERPDAVNFYACHQAFIWLRRVTQEYSGLTNSGSVDIFPRTGTVSASNLPLVMAVGEKEGLLHDGDLVSLFQGGTGMTWSGMAVRWGR